MFNAWDHDKKVLHISFAVGVMNLFYRVIMQLMWMTVLAESIYLVHHTVHVCY